MLHQRWRQSSITVERRDRRVFLVADRLFSAPRFSTQTPTAPDCGQNLFLRNSVVSRQFRNVVPDVFILLALLDGFSNARLDCFHTLLGFLAALVVGFFEKPCFLTAVSADAHDDRLLRATTRGSD